MTEQELKQHDKELIEKIIEEVNRLRNYAMPPDRSYGKSWWDALKTVEGSIHSKFLGEEL